MTDIKVCGMSTPDSIDAALSTGASHIGFVFFPPSPRHLSPDRAASLIARVPSGRGRVAVLVDADDALVDAVLGAGIDTLQLHGRESPERVAALKARTGRTIWRARGVGTRADIAQAFATAGPADLLLLDAKAPNDSPLPGGNGVSFDWRLMVEARADRQLSHPWGLSGGLDAGNVGEALAALRPALVDVSSGVEVSPGVKSVEKIAAFAAAVKAAR